VSIDYDGLVVMYWCYVFYLYVYYVGELVDGVYLFVVFGDVVIEVCICIDGDEGLFVFYFDV